MFWVSGCRSPLLSVLRTSMCKFTTHQGQSSGCRQKPAITGARQFHGKHVYRVLYLWWSDPTPACRTLSCWTYRLTTGHSPARKFSTSPLRCVLQKQLPKSSNRTGLIYIIAVFVFMLGGAYAGVPLYKVFCQAAGLGGQAVQGHDTSVIETMERVDRSILVKFNADVASSMKWHFKPQQTEVMVHPGETALAFYTAKNPTDEPIIGISTYNILPYEAGQYFNKIQCFCFEEQRLNPNEQVDMPVFFYIDPEFAEDPKLENVNSIILSYTFFQAKEGLVLPYPGYLQFHGRQTVTPAAQLPPPTQLPPATQLVEA